MSSSSNSNIQNKNIASNYNISFNFYGICNGAFPSEIKEQNNLLEKKRKNSNEIELKEIDENNPNKIDIINNENNDLNKDPILKISFYDEYPKNKEIRINETEDNKGDIVEQINLEENENENENENIEEITDYKNDEYNNNNIMDIKKEKSKSRQRKKKKTEEEEDISYSMSKSYSKIISESVSLSSSITPIKEISHKNKSKKRKTKDDSFISSDSEKQNKKDNSTEIDPLTLKNMFNNPHDLLPDFLKQENIRDKNGNKPNSPNYDCNTLYIPTEYLKQQSDTMLQFWEFKRDNFDKIIFFKRGRFYEMFYDDAIICNQLLDIRWMGTDPKILHVGFPEIALESKAAILIDAGFKIAIVEQMETPKQVKERLKSEKGGEKAVKRNIIGVLTKGTYYNYDEDINNKNSIHNNININFANTSKNKFCIALFKYEKETNIINEEIFLSENNIIQNEPIVIWGFCIFDITTLQFYLGKIEEDPQKYSPKTQKSQRNENSYSKIKSLLYNISPEEIICVNKNIPDIMINFIKGLSSRPLINNIKNNYKYSELNDLCIKYFGKDFQKWNPLIVSLFADEKEKYPTCVSFYLTIIYLEKIFFAKNTLPISDFHDYSENIILNPNKKMILDYDSITNLELLETNYDPKNPESGSFIEYFNKAVSPFGKRLLKNWILNPLYDIAQINERLDIVEDLINNDMVISLWRESLSKWPDIERQCIKFFKLALESNQEKEKENNHTEDINKNRMKDFFKLIYFLFDCQKIFNIFNEYIIKNKFKSKTLIKKVTIGEGVPDLNEAIKKILNNYKIIDTQDEKNNIVPKIITKPGKYPEYDKIMLGFDNVNKKFNEILLKERRRLKCTMVNYAHTKNIRYELEIPENIVKDNRPKEYILTTSKKGFLRFHTKEIIDNVNKLEELEEQLKYFTGKLNKEIFKIFYNQKNTITSFINAVSEIDCFMSLAFISVIDIDKFSRPNFISLEKNNGIPYLELIQCVHPCLLGRINYFVPNNIYLGKEGKTTIVITGPNMGGKSTLLKQVCISMIMAQIGCFVPAKRCIMTLVDRIFTRLGARDKLLEGKSTFFIEMEETKNILDNATKNSLIIMDELGRGTSTKDGQIIAKTILYQMENKLKSRCLFTTHYHDIIEWCKKQPKIRLSFMDSKIDENTKDINFLYQFKDGICPESYGIEVAKLAGIPSKVINIAKDIKAQNKLGIK